MSKLAYSVSEVAHRWVPDHAYIDVDETDFDYWSATWSTPEGICTVKVNGSDFMLSVRWTDVTLRYAGLARVSALLDLLVPLAKRPEDGAA